MGVFTSPALVAELDRHNGTHKAPEQIQLRMAVHAGEVRYDRHDTTAAAVNLAFRLLDAPALKAALASSPGVLAVIASSWFFQEVIKRVRQLETSAPLQLARAVAHDRYRPLRWRAASAAQPGGAGAAAISGALPSMSQMLSWRAGKPAWRLGGLPAAGTPCQLGAEHVR